MWKNLTFSGSKITFSKKISLILSLTIFVSLIIVFFACVGYVVTTTNNIIRGFDSVLMNQAEINTQHQIEIGGMYFQNKIDSVSRQTTTLSAKYIEKLMDFDEFPYHTPVNYFYDYDESHLPQPTVIDPKTQSSIISLAHQTFYISNSFKPGDPLTSNQLSTIYRQTYAEPLLKTVYDLYNETVSLFTVFIEDDRTILSNYPGAFFTGNRDTYDPATQDWYNSAKFYSNKTYVTDSYADEYGNGWLTTINRKHKNSESVTATDTTISQILLDLETMKIYSTKNTIIRVDNGAVFADSELLTLNIDAPTYHDLVEYPISNDLWSKISSINFDNFTMPYNDSIVLFGKFIEFESSVKYVIMSYVPVSVLKKPGQTEIQKISQTRTIVLVCLAVICILIALISSLISNYLISKELYPLIRASEEVKNIAKNIGSGVQMKNVVNSDFGAINDEGIMLQNRFMNVVNNLTNVPEKRTLELSTFGIDLSKYSFDALSALPGTSESVYSHLEPSAPSILSITKAKKTKTKKEKTIKNPSKEFTNEDPPPYTFDN